MFRGQPKPPKDPEDERAIEFRAVDLLSRREHSEAELRRKLIHKGFAVDAVNVVLKRLQERQWQSNERFAESFFRQRVNQGYGPLRIRMEMSQKGLKDYEIEAVFTDFAPDWCELAKQRYQRRFSDATGNIAKLNQLEAKERAKRQRFLAQRGFTAEQVYAAITAAEDDGDVAVF